MSLIDINQNEFEIQNIKYKLYTKYNTFNILLLNKFLYYTL